MVPTVGGSDDRSVDRLHGGGEHHRPESPTEVDRHRDLRRRSRLWLLVWTAGGVPTCRRPPSGIPVLIQYRGRDRTGDRARDRRAFVGAAVPTAEAVAVRGCDSVHRDRPHGVALDDRPDGGALVIGMAGAERG